MSIHRVERTINGSVNVNVGNNNPVKVFVGAAVILLLTWLLLTGTLTGLFASTYCSINADASFQECCGADSYGSATYFIFQLITGACWLVGSFLTALWSGIIFLVGDIVSAIKQISAERRNTQEVVDQVTQQVTSDMLDPSDGVPSQSVMMAVDSEGTVIEELNQRINRRATISGVQDMYKKIKEEMAAIAEHVDFVIPEPPKPMSMEEMQAKILELEAEKASKATPRTRRTVSK